MAQDKFANLKESITKQKKIIKEIISSKKQYNQGSSEEKKIISGHIKSLKDKLVEVNKETENIISELNVAKPLKKEEPIIEKSEDSPSLGKPTKKQYKQIEIPTRVVLNRDHLKKEFRPDKLEKETFKRIDKQRKTLEKKKKIKISEEVNPFVKMANRFFSNFSKKLVDDKTFETLERDLIKASMKFTAQEYMSTIMLSTIVSIFIALIIMLFFLFFNIGPDLPIVTRTTEDFTVRLLKVFWLIFVIPIGTMLIMFFYPSIEKNAAGNKMDQEMPFATIHMSAISGSMINPTKIFEILITTKEYPNLSKQFTKLINEINLYGYDIVSALRNASYNCPSKKLSELYNGLATTINSGGDLPEFFEKRSETLLFEYGLEKEKRTKSAETFMDIYISVVIAAPMILMILLMMMKISGLGISLSTQLITLIMIVAVTVINILFLSFLEVKK